MCVEKSGPTSTMYSPGSAGSPSGVVPSHRTLAVVAPGSPLPALICLP